MNKMKTLNLESKDAAKILQGIGTMATTSPSRPLGASLSKIYSQSLPRENQIKTRRYNRDKLKNSL